MPAVQLLPLIERHFLPDCCQGKSAPYRASFRTVVRRWATDLRRAPTTEDFSADATWIRRQIQLLKLPEVWLKRVAVGELSLGMGHALVHYADRPAVMARIEDDMLANPWAWRTVADFERNANILATGENSTRKPATPSELKPMRATPGNGQRQRESRAKAGPAANAASDVPSSADPHVLPDVDRSTDGTHHAGGEADRATTFDVPQIIAAIRQLESLEDLDQIIRAAEGRRRAMIEIPK